MSINIEALGIEEEDGVIFYRNVDGYPVVLYSERNFHERSFILKKAAEIVADNYCSDDFREEAVKSLEHWLEGQKAARTPEKILECSSNEDAETAALEINTHFGHEIARVSPHGTHPGIAHA